MAQVFRPQTDVSSGQIIHWSFVDGTGNDTAGASFLGIPTNGPTFVPGAAPGGGGLKFNGTSQYVIVSKGPINIPFCTISAWVKINGNPASIGQVAAFDDGLGSGTTDKILFVTISGTVSWEVFDGASKTVTSTRTVTDNNWHHILGGCDGTTSYLYIDGTLEGSLAAGASYAAYTVPNFFVNGAGSSTTYLAGLISDVRVYNRALIAGEVNTLYKSAFLPWMENEFEAVLATVGTAALAARQIDNLTATSKPSGVVQL